MAQIAGFRGALGDPSKPEGELVRDPTRAMYRYHQTFVHQGRSLIRKSVYVAMQLVPWTDGSVRAHAATDPAARDAALADIAKSGTHTAAVLAGYRDAAGELDRLFRKAESERPALEVTTADGTRHQLWRVHSAEVIGKVRPLFAPKKLHVLAGHARYEAMVAYRDRVATPGLPTYSSANFGLGCLVNLDDPALVVAARHRILKGDAKRDAVLAAANKYFIVDKLPGAAKDLAKQIAALADTVAHQPAFVASFAGDGDAYKLTLKPDVSPTAEGVEAHRAIQKYDPVVVEHVFLARCVPGAAATTELDPAAVVKAVEGGAAIGIVMRPLAIDQITHADELGSLLPSGYTALHPPVGSLVTYIVDPDEDVV